VGLPETLRRPLVGRPTAGVWTVVLLAIYRGYTAYDDSFNPDWAGLSWDPGGNVGANFRTYRYAAELAMEGQSFYGVPPPGLEDWAVYLYPPITVVAYYPFTVLEWMSGYWIVVCLNALAGVGVAAAIVYYIDRSGRCLGWVDVALVGGLLVVSPFTFGTMYFGNINVVLALAVVVGFLALEYDRSGLAGAAFGAAALFKLFPALVGAWLLRRRSWRSIGSATAVGGGGVLAGVAAYGWGPTVVFFTDVVFGRTDATTFVGGYPADGTYYVTIQRPLSHVLWGIFPDAPPELLVPLAVLVAASLLAAFYASVETRFERLTAMFATMVVTVTLFPALQWHLVLLFFPMVPLWYLWDGPGRRLFLAGSAVLFVNVRPGSLVEGIESAGLAHLLESVLLGVVSVATLQLYGIGIMLVACALARYRLDPGQVVARTVATFVSGRTRRE